MNLRKNLPDARLSVVVLALALGPLAPGPCEAFARGPAEAAQSYAFAFHDADIPQVAEAILSGSLGLTYTIDPSVSGKMSFRIDRRLTQAQLLEAFEAVLKSYDVVMVRQGDSLLLEPRSKAKGSASLETLGGGGVHGVGYETLAVPLSYAPPSEVAKALQAVTSNDIVVYVDDKQGLLILGGDPAELEAAVALVRTFDHGGLEDSKIRFFQLEQAPAETVGEDLGKVLEAAGVSGVTVVPLKRLNGLFIFARNAKALEAVSDWIAKLDVPPKDTVNAFYTYHPHDVAAEELSGSVISMLTGRAPPGGTGSGSPPQFASASAGLGPQPTNFGGGSAAFGQTPGAMGAALPSAALTSQPTASAGGATMPGGGQDGLDGMRIGFDRGSNTVLVMAPPARWIQLQKMLQEIDRAPAQILIEASVLEVTLNNQFNFGVDWSVTGANGALNVQNVNSTAGTIAAATPGLAATYLGKDISAAINALESKTTVEVVSNPKILALDNHTAQLQIGDEVPIVTQTGVSTSSPGAPVINSINYLDTGVILTVTPRISGDRIYLDLDQEVSDTTDTSTSGIDSPTVEQRRLQTTLIMSNGGLVALGGLISDSRTKGGSGIPWLMDVPGVGALFRTTTKSTTRTELILLITAKVVSDKPAEDKATVDLLADMKEIDKRGLLKR